MKSNSLAVSPQKITSLIICHFSSSSNACSMWQMG
jgi:hypothetical protein